MTVPVEETDWWVPKRPRKTIEEILAEVGSKPMSAADFEKPGAFDGDEELEEFIVWVRKSRAEGE